MANEITKVTDQNGVDHPFKDVAAFPRSEQAVLGAKNIIPYPYHSPNSYTSHGVGFTVNTNKTVTTDSGTASGDDAVFTLLQKSDTAFNDFFELTKGKTIKLTGVPEGASTSTYWLMIYDTSEHNLVSGEMEYQMPETMPSAFYLQIVVKNGQSASNKIWKPMISFDGGEYVPPAMTNRELTDAVVKNHNLSLYYKELMNETTGANSEINITLDAPVKFAMVVGNNMKVYYDNRAYEPFVSAYTSAGSSTVTLRFAKQGTQELMPQGTSVTVAIMFAVVYA